MGIVIQHRGLEPSNISSPNFKDFEPKWTRNLEVLARKFLELGGHIGFGSILTQDVLTQMISNFNMVLHGDSLRHGRNCMQFYYYFSRVFDFHPELKN